MKSRLVLGIVCFAASLAVVQILWIARGTQTLPPQLSPTIAAVVTTGTWTTTTCALIIATFIAFGRYRVLCDSTSWWIGIGLASFSVGTVFRIFTFPFAPGTSALIGRSPDTSAWIIMSASTLFAGCLLKAMLDRNPSVEQPKSFVILLAWCLLEAIVFAAFIAFGELLPAVVAPDGTFTALELNWHWLVAALLGWGAILSIRRYLSTSDYLPAYVAFAQIALAFAHLWSSSGGSRFSSISVAARFAIPIGCLIMVFALLSDYASLLRREKQTSRELRIRSVELAAILEEIPEAVFVTDPKGVVRFASKSALTMCGVSSVGHMEQPEWLPLSRVIGGESLHSEEVQYLKPFENSPRWLLVSGGPLVVDTSAVSKSAVGAKTDDTNAMVGCLVVAADITLRKQKEREVLHLNESLQRQVREMQIVESALRRSNHDLQQFAYVSSHDLREPLRNVATHSQLLMHAYKNGTLDEHGEYSVQIITGAAIRMEALITGLLNYSRATSDSEGLFEEVDLNAAVEQAIANLETAVAETGAEIIRERLPRVPGIPTQLVQVFQNLIGNSIKYRRLEARPRIEISARDGDESWVLCVRDNGQGFRSEYADRIFRIFQRLHGPDIPGTGVGLSICRAIVDRHGGKIWAEGELNRGAGFYFTLPRINHV